MLAEMIPNFGRHEQCLPRLASIIYVVAQRKPQLICLAEFVAECPRKRGVAEIIIRALALRREVRYRAGIVERSQQPAQLRAAIARPKRAAFSFELELWSRSRPAMRENLYHA